jgi:hypothetical protein
MATDRTMTPLGYAWLKREFTLNPIPHFIESCAADPGTRITERTADRVREIYPHTAHRLNGPFEHLEFALNREGLHLQLLRALLPRLPRVEVEAFVRATPTGANARRIAYLYESFSGERLNLPDLTLGNYVPLADPDLYFTGPIRRVQRWRIQQNLLHTLEFSPMLRRVPELAPERDAALHARCAELVAQVPPEIFQRALRYLYARETRTSYAIERETPTQQRAERFMALLHRAGAGEFLTQEGLVNLQHAIVDSRFAADGWRTSQNYVGQSLAPGIEEVHLVPPRPDDIDSLMSAWQEVARSLCMTDHVPPVTAAAWVAWAFVYLHPFEDGNGRIHRFLIHHVLAARRFGPTGVLLPLSAVLLNRPADYEASLESFSVPLKARSDYELDDDLRMAVKNDTLEHFRYMDLTPVAVALHGFLAETIEREVPSELRFLRAYDAARAAMREVVDLPEPTANLFVRLCFHNQGRLSKNKRGHKAFEKLTEEEINRLETAVAAAYAGTNALPPSSGTSPADAD